MKILILESFYVFACILFWVFALPLALVAFPALAIVNRASQIYIEDFTALAKHLTLRPA